MTQKSPFRRDAAWAVAAAMHHCASHGLQETTGASLFLALMQLPNSAVVSFLKSALGLERKPEDEAAAALRELWSHFHTIMLAKGTSDAITADEVQLSENLKLVLRKAVCLAQGIDRINTDGSNIDDQDPDKLATPAHLFLALMAADAVVGGHLAKRCNISPANTFLTNQIIGFQKQSDQKLGMDKLFKPDDIDGRLGVKAPADEDIEKSLEPEPDKDKGLEASTPGLYRDMAGGGGKGRPSPSRAIAPVQRTASASGRNRLPTDSTLLKYGIDLTAKAERQGGKNPIIGRDEDINRLIQVLMRKGKKNAALIGEPGVGKTAIVEGLAQRIVAGKVPEFLQDAVIMSLDMGDAVGGTRYRGDFEERLKEVLKELQQYPEVILFIDEMHTLIGAGKGSDGTGSAAQLMKAALADGSIKCIGATTRDEYKNHIEKDPALSRRFLPVYVNEPTEEDTLEILEGLRPFYEDFHKLSIADDALVVAIDLAVRFLKAQGRTLPDAPIDLIDSTCAFLRFKNELGLSPEGETLSRELIQLRRSIKKAEHNRLHNLVEELRQRAQQLEEQLALLTKDRTKQPQSGLVVTAEDVRKTASFWSRIPLDAMTANEREMLLNLEKLLKARVFGQDAVIDEIVPAIRAARALKKIKDILPPSFLFSGPTGVGKTLLARVLADILGVPLIRLDMSEYKEQHTVSTLIGAPPGYKDGDVNGTLTEPVRRNPYCVLLLDELEKAHRDVDDLLLQIQDNGFLHDRQGRKIDFRHVILIGTDNVGSQHQDEVVSVDNVIGESMSDDETFEESELRVKEELRRVFKPEFLNRFTALPVFRKHAPEVVRKIVAHLVAEEMKVYLTEWDIKLTLDKGALALLNRTVSGVFNARPVKRKIQKLVRDVLVKEVLGQVHQSGDELIGTVVDNGGKRRIVFTKVQQEARR